MSESPPHEQMGLLEEVAVARVSAVTALKLAEPALNGKAGDKALALSLECLREAMNHVRDLVVAATKVDALSRGRVSVKVVELIILQVIRAIRDECGGDEGLAERIEKRVESDVRLPADERNVGARLAEGISSTPDRLAEAMDASVDGG